MRIVLLSMMDFSEAHENELLEATAEDVSLVIRNWPKQRYDELVIGSWFQPGTTVFWEDLIKVSNDIDTYFHIPLPLLCICVRKRDTLEMFHIDFMKDLDDNFKTISILFTPWVHSLEPAFCKMIGLDMNRLVTDGLSRSHVRRLYWPLSRWKELFCFEERYFEILGIRKPYKFFRHFEQDIAEHAQALKISI
jgi:hypothetical protein